MVQMRGDDSVSGARKVPTTEQYPLGEDQIRSRSPEQLIEYMNRLIKQLKTIQENTAMVLNSNADAFNGALQNGSIKLSVDETTDTLTVRATYRDGTTKTATLPLT